MLEIPSFLSGLAPVQVEDELRQVVALAHILFRAGDLTNCVAVWDLAIEATTRYGLERDEFGQERLAGYLGSRASALDHLDDLDGALAGYRQALLRWRDVGRTGVTRFPEADIARLRAKIEHRDAGQRWIHHRREFRPDVLETEIARWRQHRADWLPWIRARAERKRARGP